MIPGETGAQGALRNSALASILPALVLGAAGAGAFAAQTGLSDAYLVRVTTLLAAGAVVLFVGLPAHAPHARFGAANRVTLARAVLMVWVLCLVGETHVPQPTAFVLAALAAGMDALDGRLARLSGLQSRYGARFDMETDALLILALALLVWQQQRAPAWVLLSGAMRYLFLGATLPPRLRGSLRPSVRRRAMAVVQVVALLAAFAPFVPPHVALACAALGLVALAYSFTTDLIALWRDGAARA